MSLVGLYRTITVGVRTYLNCLRSGLPFNKTWDIKGKVHVHRYSLMSRLIMGRKNGDLTIGNGFKCRNNVDSNTIGIIQPTILNIVKTGSKLIIGENVGISGATICATDSITIGNNVQIGSGCIITDTDSHPVRWQDRLENQEATKSAPVVIEDNAFIGARSIILKGVTIGFGSVIGAGSVVCKSIPANVVACGNPAKVVKQL